MDTEMVALEVTGSYGARSSGEDGPGEPEDIGERKVVFAKRIRTSRTKSPVQRGHLNLDLNRTHGTPPCGQLLDPLGAAAAVAVALGAPF
jgi:hypothetical protein